MIIIDKETGQEYEVLDGSRERQPYTSYSNGANGDATHYLVRGGVFAEHGSSRALHGTPLRLVRPRHTFGGVVFEETGEVRKPEKDEFYLGNVTDGRSVLTQHGPGRNHGSEYPILRPVALEPGNGE